MGKILKVESGGHDKIIECNNYKKIASSNPSIPIFSK